MCVQVGGVGGGEGRRGNGAIQKKFEILIMRDLVKINIAVGCVKFHQLHLPPKLSGPLWLTTSVVELAS